jgi:TPR repeat protein
MKHILFLFFFVFLTVSAFAQEQLPTYGLFVGINKYLHSDPEKGLDNLNYARNDAEALAAQFKSIGAKKVLTLTDSDTSDDRPTAKNILKVLKEIKEEIPQKAVFVLSISGHGITLDSESRFCPIETNPDTKETLVQTTLPIDEIYKVVNEIPAQYKLMFVDACRNVPDAVHAARAIGFNARGVSKGIAIVTKEVQRDCILFQSCKEGEQSYEPIPETLTDEERQHANGYFTGAILDCFRNRDKITLFGLSDHITEFTKDKSRNKQHPVINFPRQIGSFILYRKPVVNIDWHTPKAVLEAEAEKNNPAALCILARCYFYGTNYCNRDNDKASELYQRGSKFADSGNPYAQCCRGYCYYYGIGVKQDYAVAVKWARKAAEQEFAQVQNNLGWCYKNGFGVIKDEKEAVKWYRKAAEQNYADAQNHLGWCYYNGHGVEQDTKEAVKWYRKAAEQEFAQAQYNLGWCYNNGIGVILDSKEAVKWYRKAAEQNYADAQIMLGNCYYYGNGVKQDYTEAVKWYRKAAEQEVAQAQFTLGWCCENGWGVIKNEKEAVKWYRKAVEQGYEEAKVSLERLEKESNAPVPQPSHQSLPPSKVHIPGTYPNKPIPPMPKGGDSNSRGIRGLNSY